MNVGQFQSELLTRILMDAGLLWVVVAIAMGLWASEIKKRPFWLWVLLSLVTGPIAWYLIVVRLPVYIPKEKRVACPSCGKTISSDAKACPYCKKWISKESQDRAAELGKKAATTVFAARHFLGAARRAADAARAERRGQNGSAPAHGTPPTPKSRPPTGG